MHVATLNKPIGLENGYGPIESVIHGLDKGLQRSGYRSIVACSSDASVHGEKFETVPEGLGDYCSAGTGAAQQRIALHLSRALARSRAGDIDVVHMHEWFERIYSSAFTPSVPVVMTLHVPAEHSGMSEFQDRNPSAPLASNRRVHWVAISKTQRRQYEGLIPIAQTIPHGIDVGAYPTGLRPAADGYLFNIGRITEVKGQDTAIEVARRSGIPLILAGCVQDKPEDRAFFARLRPSIDKTVDLSGVPVGPDYFDRVMRPLLASGAKVIFVGELNEQSKKQWYRYALATVFPIRWSEPFGMVLIESMASGTPLIAFDKGAVPEVVADGETGFIVDNLESMVRAVGDLRRIDRRAVRRHVERHFSIDVMARRYAALYEEIVSKESAAAERALARGGSRRLTPFPS